MSTGADGVWQDELQMDLCDRHAAHHLADLGGSVGLVAGRLYNAVQIKHPRNARFSLQNERGLFFVKIYQAALVSLAQGFEPGTKLAVLGELHSFVNRRCKNHHIYIKAQKIFPLTEPPVDLIIKIEKE